MASVTTLGYLGFLAGPPLIGLVAEWTNLHASAAAFYRQNGAGEKALYHLMAINDSEGLANELTRLARQWIDEGRLVTLLSWLLQPGNAFLEWMRMPGDVIFLVPGILPFLWIAFLGIRYGIKATATEMEPETLFVEEHPEAYEDRTGALLPATRYASDRRTDVLVDDPDREDRR